MSDHKDDIRQIEDFLDGKMDETRMTSFQKRLELEPDLNLQLEQFQVSRKSVITKGLKLKLQQIQEDRRSHQTANRTVPWTIGIAASLLLGVLLFIYFPEAPSNDELYSKYFIAFPAPGIQRGTGQNNTSILDLYRMERYDEFLMHLYGKRYDSDTLTLLVANANLKLEEFTIAERQLLSIGTDSPLYGSAEWYKALIHVKNGNYDEAQQILSSQPIQTSLYSGKAKKLLEEIQ